MTEPTPERPGLRRSEPSSLGFGRKFGPLALVMALIAGLGVYLASTSAVSGGGGSGSGTAAERGPESIGDVRVLPPGVETFARAKKNGTAEGIDWGDRCDVSTGKLKLPLWPQADCFKPFTGANGGSTEIGVTATTIKLVLYRAQMSDPILKFIYAQINNTDTPEQTFETNVGFTKIFNRYYELYGRHVELVPYEATGNISDATAASADAETIARDLKPFGVIGGPTLTVAFADTLARNHIMCIACAPGQPADWYDQRSPYVWDVQKTADQALFQTAEYLGKRLWNRRAEFAGDPAMRSRKRVFGYVHVRSGEAAQTLEDGFVARLRKDYGMSFAEVQTFGSPTELAGTGKDIITKLKEAGVTTVVYGGDPLAPQALTRIATAQQFFPEWVIGPTLLVDTAIFSRTYDQRQWAHAFGPSNLFARSDRNAVGPGYLYKWYFGTEAPARTNVPLIAGPLQVLFGAFQGAGPGLTHDLFKRVLFGSPIIASTPISAQVSFGNRGIFPDPDYAALDDQTEVWWDATATGPAENGIEGKGLWRYVDGGKRYLPGEWPKAQPTLFDPAGTVTIYRTPPAGTKVPSYEPLR